MKKNLSLEILNSEELQSMHGGGGDGDVIFKECLLGKDVTIVTCATYEASCPTSITGCLKEGFTCTGGVTIKELKAYHN